MIPISIKKYAKMIVKNNPNMKEKDLVESLELSLEDKDNGAKCICCGQPIWSAGSAITGTNMCFTCITGEADDSEDYEITK